ncbi:MAG: hypothetical protein LBS91_08080 [Clostridiales Family XIII bacterium]|nr:hypothetical protein [Clostridiales Family XIII bacterium]
MDETGETLDALFGGRAKLKEDAGARLAENFARARALAEKRVSAVLPGSAAPAADDLLERIWGVPNKTALLARLDELLAYLQRRVCVATDEGVRAAALERVWRVAQENADRLGAWVLSSYGLLALPQPAVDEGDGLLRDARNDGTGARNDGTGARNGGTEARNDGTGACNDGTGARNDGTGARNGGTGACNGGTGARNDGTEARNGAGCHCEERSDAAIHYLVPSGEVSAQYAAFAVAAESFKTFAATHAFSEIGLLRDARNDGGVARNGCDGGVARNGCKTGFDSGLPAESLFDLSGLGDLDDAAETGDAARDFRESYEKLMDMLADAAVIDLSPYEQRGKRIGEQFDALLYAFGFAENAVSTEMNDAIMRQSELLQEEERLYALQSDFANLAGAVICQARQIAHFAVTKLALSCAMDFVGPFQEMLDAKSTASLFANTETMLSKMKKAIRDATAFQGGFDQSQARTVALEGRDFVRGIQGMDCFLPRLWRTDAMTGGATAVTGGMHGVAELPIGGVDDEALAASIVVGLRYCPQELTVCLDLLRDAYARYRKAIGPGDFFAAFPKGAGKGKMIVQEYRMGYRQRLCDDGDGADDAEPSGSFFYADEPGEKGDAENEGAEITPSALRKRLVRHAAIPYRGSIDDNPYEIVEAFWADLRDFAEALSSLYQADDDYYAIMLAELSVGQGDILAGLICCKSKICAEEISSLDKLRQKLSERLRPATI